MKRLKVVAALLGAVMAVTLLSACGKDDKKEETTTTTAQAQPTKNLVELASGTPDLSTLVTAVQAAGLTETLQTGEYTVFAPTNAAFAAIPAAKLQALLKDKATLTKILTYHVVPGKVMASDVAALPNVATGAKVKSVEGSELTIKADGSSVMVDGATVTTADVMATNGVVHIIDKVILPPSVKL